MADNTSTFANLGPAQLERIMMLLSRQEPLDTSLVGITGPLGTAALHTANPNSLEPEPEWVNKNLSLSTKLGLLGLSGSANHNANDYGDNYDLTGDASADIPLPAGASFTPSISTGANRNISEEEDTGWINNQTGVGARLSAPFGDGKVSLSANKNKGSKPTYGLNSSMPMMGGQLSLDGNLSPQEGDRKRRLAAALTYRMNF